MAAALLPLAGIESIAGLGKHSHLSLSRPTFTVSLHYKIIYKGEGRKANPIFLEQEDG